MSQSAERNNLLSSLSEPDFRLIEPRLEWVDLSLRQRIEQPRTSVEWAYFPSSGICSVIAAATANRRAEVGIVGREGMTGLSVVLESGVSVTEVLVQAAGQARRIASNDLRLAME